MGADRPAEDEALVVVGWLGAPHGLDGTLRLLPETDFPERLRPGRAVVLVAADGRRRLATRLRAARPAGPRRWLVAVEGLPDRTAAQAYAGGRLCVERASLPPLPAGRFYHHEVVGLAVLDAGGRRVGEVVRVLPNPAHDVYVVRRPDGREALVPAVRAAVAAIDVAAGVLRLQDLPGLLD